MKQKKNQKTWKHQLEHIAEGPGKRENNFVSKTAFNSQN